MKNKIMKKPFGLAGLMLLINLLAGAIMLGIIYLFKIGNLSLASIGSVLAPMTAGQLYASSFKEEVPKKLRLNSAIIFCIIVTIATLLVFFVNKDLNLLSLAIIAIVMPLYCLFVYWSLGNGAKRQLKLLEKIKEKQKR